MYKIPLILSKIFLCLVFSWFKKIRISLMPDLDSVHFQEHNDIFYVNTLQKLNKWDGKMSISQTYEINYNMNQYSQWMNTYPIVNESITTL